jgi:hypothetical protein
MYTKEYKVKIQHKDKEEILTIKSHNIKWTMDQYQRNREPFKWTVIQ